MSDNGIRSCICRGKVSFGPIFSFLLDVVPKRLMSIVEFVSSEKNQSIYFILNLDHFTNSLDFTRLIKSTLRLYLDGEKVCVFGTVAHFFVI